MTGTVSENLLSVTDRIRKAARKAGRDPEEITLVAVTKGVELKKIKEAYAGGVRVFGENYVQEAEEKVSKIKDGAIRWHFIGHLQKNKVKRAVELFDCIQTVDGLELAVELNKRSHESLDVLIEVNIAKEKTKTGVDVEGAVKLAREFDSLQNLKLRGLFTIPPFSGSQDVSRPYFVTLRRLAERINKERIPGVFLHDLSMGMSNDFEVAIEEGATIVRIGTAIFGPRNERHEKKGANPAEKRAQKNP